MDRLWNVVLGLSTYLHMGMMSGTMNKCEILFPMPRLKIKIKEVVEALGRLRE